MSEMKLKGTYLFYSEQEGKLPGIKFKDETGEKWYNFGPDKRALFDSIKAKKGSEVEMTVDSGQITEFKITKEVTPQKKPWSGGFRKPEDKYDSISFYNGCMVNACQYIQSIKTDKTITAKDWAGAVAEYTGELVKAIKERQAFGPPQTTTAPPTTSTTESDSKPEEDEDALEEENPEDLI